MICGLEIGILGHHVSRETNDDNKFEWSPEAKKDTKQNLKDY